MTLLDIGSDPIVGLIFVSVMIIAIAITGLTGGNVEKTAKWFNVSESTGNRSKANKRRILRRKLEKELNLPYESLSYYSLEQLEQLKKNNRK